MFDQFLCYVNGVFYPFDKVGHQSPYGHVYKCCVDAFSKYIDHDEAVYPVINLRPVN
ncbi:hypothetical protein RCO48_22710 [Peribacillus frigoritolerans]|nr:hypothetical protein [Peribacillus frigoritolerans]